MRHILQPEDQPCCGLICCAMLLGKSLSTVRAETGLLNRTTTKELTTYLQANGWHGQNHLRPIHNPKCRNCHAPLPPDPSALPPVAICKLSLRKPNGRLWRNWHWVLWAEGRFWDPSFPNIRTLRQQLTRKNIGGQRGTLALTSYIPLTRTLMKSDSE